MWNTRARVSKYNIGKCDTKCTFVLSRKRLPCVFDYFWFVIFWILHVHKFVLFFLLLLEKKGGGGDGDEGKSMSHWEYIMHDCCLRVYSLKCVPHRYLSGCHIWATLKCGDENRWNVCEHTRSFAQWKWWFYGWWWCWFRCRINICLVFHLNKWPWLWWNTHAHTQMHLHPQNDTERAKHQNILVFQRTVYCLRFERCRPTKCIRMKFDREIKSTLKCVCKTTTTATSESYKTKAPANPSAGLKWIEEKRRRRSRRFVAVVFMVWHLLIICMRSI